MSDLVAVDQLVLDERLYPRAGVSDPHVREIMRVMAGGHILPPVIVWKKNNKIADGAHRWNAAIRAKVEFIAVEFRNYKNDEEFFKDAVLLNSATGQPFSNYDRLRVIQLGREFGLKELDLATLLRTSESYIKAVAPRYATVSEADAKGDVQRVARVPLKASVRHLSHQSITPKQADAIRGNAPGQSYMLLVNQLISGLENDLLPPEDQHPSLWKKLAFLRSLLPAESPVG